MAEVKAILTRRLDALCAGGLSILVLMPLLLIDFEVPRNQDGFLLIVLGSVINGPHFLASYWLLYRSREMVRRHPWAAIRIPAAILLFSAVALAFSPEHRFGVNLVLFSATVYLAWHYTGQAWGMMASFAAIEGVPFQAAERGWLRASTRLLLVWHVFWALRFGGRFEGLREETEAAYAVSIWLIPLSLGVGAWGLHRMRRRTGRLPPLRVVVPWASLYVWYALMAKVPEAIVLVQASHSLQYLPFPLRVELNRKVPAGGESAAGAMRVGLAIFGAGLALFFLLPQALEGFRLPLLVGRTPAAIMALCAAMAVGMIWAARYRPQNAAARLLAYGIGLLVAGTAAFWLAPILVYQAMAALPSFSARALDASLMLVALLNIHHYFTDGCVWKISTPEVRRELFAHLAPAARTA